ncbi:hypothetical protein ENHY17A_50031 [Moraxellaceae bacterium 17A]|nr:hypothetical protein ENHY17A_50031 [Moraxellaceae bacterium 17A]
MGAALPTRFSSSGSTIISLVALKVTLKVAFKNAPQPLQSLQSLQPFKQPDHQNTIQSTTLKFLMRFSYS